MSQPYAAYPRVSRIGARDEDRLRSPDLQLQLIRQKAKTEGLTIVEYPAEIDVSGAKPARAILNQIIAAIQAGDLAGIIVAKLDRLSRLSPRDRVTLFDQIETAGGRVLSASETLDTTTPEGRFARDVFLGVARMQWEQYRDGFDRAKAGAMDAGIKIGPTPFGYERGTDGRIVPHPVWSPVVTEAFRLAAEDGLHAAVQHLAASGASHEHGKRTGRPRRWTTATVRRLLANRVYLGENTYGDDTRRDQHTPLVSRAMFEAAQHEPLGRRRPADHYPFSGLASCASCGGPMVGGRGGPGLRTYRCRASLTSWRGDRCSAGANIVADRLEGFVREWLLTVPQPVRAAEGEAESLDALAAEITAAEHELDDLIADMELRRSLGADRFRALAAQHRATLDERQAAYREAAKRDATGRVTLDRAVVESASLVELGEIARAVLDRVVVKRGRLPLGERVVCVVYDSPVGSVASA